jgi:hypothetical protein
MVSKTHQSDNSLKEHPVFDFTLILNVLTYTQSFVNFTLFFIEV